MIVIGIRAAPTAVTFAIYDSSGRSILNVEEIVIPKAFHIPDALKYVRSNLLDVLREYKVDRAAIRAIEPNAQKLNIERVQIEGVIQEAFASSEISEYFVCQIANITAWLGISRDQFKPMVAGTLDAGIPNWAQFNPHQREAVLCAKGAAAYA